MRITDELLTKLGACQKDLVAFRHVYPNGANLDKETLKIMMRIGLGVDRLFKGEQRDLREIQIESGLVTVKNGVLHSFSDLPAYVELLDQGGEYGVLLSMHWYTEGVHQKQISINNLFCSNLKMGLAHEQDQLVKTEISAPFRETILGYIDQYGYLNKYKYWINKHNARKVLRLK